MNCYNIGNRKHKLKTYACPRVNKKMIILSLWTVEDNHFLLCIFINATINVSNTMMNIPKLIIRDKASEIVIIRLTSFLCSLDKEVHLLLCKIEGQALEIILRSCYYRNILTYW